VGRVKVMKNVLINLKNNLLKFKNKEFLDAAMAGAALICLADGEISLEEKQKMIRFFESHELLSVFSIKDAIKSFEEFVSQIEFDKDAGESKAYRTLAKLHKKESAIFVMQMIIAIASADGHFDLNERMVAIKITRELRLNPSRFNLSPWDLSIIYRIRGFR
jgi:tellurite resistance protein TerB